MPSIEMIANYHCACGENPYWEPKTGRFYWTDIPQGRLFCYDTGTGKHEVIYRGEQVGGFTVQADGKLLLFRVEDVALLHEDGSTQTLIRYTNPGMARFNDVFADPEGRVFAGTIGRSNESGGLYRVDLDGSVTELFLGTQCANGMGFSPDLQTMYWTCSTTRRIFAFDYDRATGTLGNRRVLVQVPEGEGVPDGMTVDTEGNLWSARWGGYGIFVYSPAGDLLRKIDLPVEKTSSCIFGGPNLDELWVTTAGGKPDQPADTQDGALFRITQPGARGATEYRSRIKV